jgi:uncharacterized membrane protein
MEKLIMKNKLLFLSLGMMAGVFMTLVAQSIIPEEGEQINWVNMSLNAVAILFLTYRVYYHLVAKDK